MSSYKFTQPFTAKPTLLAVPTDNGDREKWNVNTHTDALLWQMHAPKQVCLSHPLHTHATTIPLPHYFCMAFCDKLRSAALLSKWTLQVELCNFQQDTDPLHWPTDTVDEDVESSLLHFSIRQHFPLSQPRQHTITQHNQRWHTLSDNPIQNSQSTVQAGGYTPIVQND